MTESLTVVVVLYYPILWLGGVSYALCLLHSLLQYNSGIACLVSQASDWAAALWEGLSGLSLVALYEVSIQACLL